ncbi:MAG: IS1595 family transposase [Gaiellaceae bacterium]
MAPANRKIPKRAPSSQSLYSVTEFLREFPDDEACLQYLWRARHSVDGEHAHCPKCERERSFKRYDTAQRRQSWTCTGCGHHIHPTAGTIFHKSSTSLQLWFHAMFLVSSSRCGIAAKQLERDLGCNYKTAWRMLNRIRTVLMEQDDEPLSGEVEVDETYMGGRSRASQTRGMTKGEAIRYGMAKRPVVFAAVERGGRVKARVIPNSQGPTLLPATREYVLPGSMIFTDDWQPYKGLRRYDYTHRRINHSAKIYVDGNIHTQTIDGFFGHFKTDVRGTHHAISTRWLPSYLNEWVWKWNHRGDDEAMFRQLVTNAAMT